jgi:hypothetical protein
MERAMSVTRLKNFVLMAVIAVSIPTLGCGEDEITFTDPATIRVTNLTGGKILNVFFKDCGAALWGEDRLDPIDPVEGVIEVNASKDFTVEAGCYDFRALHLEGPDPGPLLEVILEARLIASAAVFEWFVEAQDPVDPG